MSKVIVLTKLQEILFCFYHSLPNKHPWLQPVFEEWVHCILAFCRENKYNLDQYVYNTKHFFSPSEVTVLHLLCEEIALIDNIIKWNFMSRLFEGLHQHTRVFCFVLDRFVIV